jgi:hypothetical protein
VPGFHTEKVIWLLQFYNLTNALLVNEAQDLQTNLNFNSALSDYKELSISKERSQIPIIRNHYKTLSPTTAFISNFILAFCLAWHFNTLVCSTILALKRKACGIEMINVQLYRHHNSSQVDTTSKKKMTWTD